MPTTWEELKEDAEKINDPENGFYALGLPLGASGGGDARGDQYVTVNVEVPKKLSKKQKELLQDFDNSLDEKNHSKRENFFDKLKQLRRK